MFAFKKKYFLIIESIKDINLRNIKKHNKYSIIYRNKQYKENFNELLKFRKECRLKIIDFYVANDIKLSIQLNSDGIYLSSYNKTFSVLNINRINFKEFIFRFSFFISICHYTIIIKCNNVVINN